jgi:putative hydrolase of the HAD superfamily
MVILFDLDDTLLDHSGAAAIAVRSLHQAHGALLGLELTAFELRWLELTERAMEAFARGELTVVEQRRLRMRQMFERSFTDQEADSLYRAYLETYQGSWQLYADVLPCLQALTAKRLGVITNGGREQQHLKLSSTGLAKFFELVLTPEPPFRGKPAPDLFFAAAAAMRVHPRDCVYVGDHLERDVRAAERAGMSAIWLVRELDQHSRSDADIEATRGVQRIRSLKELAGLL